MKRAFNQTFIVISMTLLLFSVGGCGEKDPSEMSPMEIINLYYKSKDKGDTETLRRIIYFPPGTTDDQKEKRVKSELTGQDEIIMIQMFDVKVKAEYETILDENTAEVGVILWGGNPESKKRIPFQQVIIKRENNVWKYVKSKYELTEDELVTIIRENPYDASAIYHLGRKYQPENPAKADRYFQKYYELEPKGFWVDESFVSGLTEIESHYNETEIYEKQLISDMSRFPKDSSFRPQGYRLLGQYYMEKKNYEKAMINFDKAEKLLKTIRNPSRIGLERLEKSQNELRLRLEGKYIDILEEVEMAHKKTR